MDLGEIGRGAFGSVNKMIFKKTDKVMAVKVSEREIKTDNYDNDCLIKPLSRESGVQALSTRRSRSE